LHAVSSYTVADPADATHAALRKHEKLRRRAHYSPRHRRGRPAGAATLAAANPRGV